MRLDDLAERQGAVDDRPQLAGRDPVEQPREVRGVLRGDAGPTLPRARTVSREPGRRRGPGRRRARAAADPCAGRGCRRCPAPRRTSRGGRAPACTAWSTTSCAPSERTRSALRWLQTPVTCAPARWASCTAALPTAPEAPLTSTRLPGPTRSRRKCRAVLPPKRIAAACSWSTPAGLAHDPVARVRRRARRARPSVPRSSRRPRRRRTPRSRRGPTASTTPE